MDAGDNTAPDIIAGGRSSIADNGIISTDPRYVSSDLLLRSNDSVQIQLDSDNSGEDADFFISNAAGTNIFNVDESGVISASGSIVHGSDANRKERLAAIDPLRVLSAVVELSLQRWSYKGEEARHLGPMAQDFKAVFGLGDTDTGIATVDADGVALAVIQGLNQKQINLREELASLRSETTALRKMAAEQQILIQALLAQR